MLDKTYRPETVEGRQYDRWEAAGAFRADPAADGEPYAIMIPPPNVTGSLHIGHAFNNTIQDILIRFHRMQGRNVLWQPGTDHAGIATQMVVERMLAEQGIALDRGIPPKDGNTGTIGREAFIDRVWAWREESGGTILKQLRRLGATCDWARERFTMDEGLSRAVLRVFVQLYKEGLIYRDKRLVNWDPKFHTAISDLEVEQREIDGHLWHLRYPVEGEAGRTIVVATTRPETMLGDTAVAVHPEDERYRDLVGKHAILPLVGRRLPIVADDYADPEQGSGAVKITPAHDFNDFEVGQRHGLEMVNILDADARINDNAPDAYCGLDRFEARRQIVADLEAQGLLERIEEHRHSVPHGDRSGVPLEPYLTDQWFADAETLAKPCIEAVEDGRTTFVPEQFSRVYFQWMRNIQPWCISRQLWWGHQVPVWYGPDGEIFVEETEAEAQAAADAHYGEPATLTRDTDVLDTWFSSALWPFSTLGWPDETPELARYYPGSVLVTGEDIIFFWVARMMMMGVHFMRDEEGAGRVPFADVYIHGLVRDAKGQKYSKSKGNVVDPVDLMDKYGADALRFTLASLAVQGRDIKLAESRIAGYRNFATKIWNAARFCELNDAAYGPDFDPANNANRVNRWIVSQLAQLEPRVRAAIEGYRFNEAAHELYQFVWHSYCDWYLEFAKPLLQSDDPAIRAETRATALWTLHKALTMLHPFMPFLTEELWEQTWRDLHVKRSMSELFEQMNQDDKQSPRKGEFFEQTGQDKLLISSRWPRLSPVLINKYIDRQFNSLTHAISEIRSARSEIGVPPKEKTKVNYIAIAKEAEEWISANNSIMVSTASAEFIEPMPDNFESRGLVLSVPTPEANFFVEVRNSRVIEAEVLRLCKEIGRTNSEVAKIDRKLANQAFVARAPRDVVEKSRERRDEAEKVRVELADALKWALSPMRWHNKMGGFKSKKFIIVEIVRALPEGRVMSYSDISDTVYGHRKSGNMVGWAITNEMSRNPETFPWWRVLTWDYRSDKEEKNERLMSEGVSFNEDGAAASAHIIKF